MIKIKNIYYMLAYAFSVLNEEGYKKVGVEEFDNIADLLSAILVKGVSTQIKRGLDKVYILISDEIPTIKGKIDVSESIKKQSMQKRRMCCSFDELSIDSYMNRIIKTTFYYLLKSDASIEQKKSIKKVLVYLNDVNTIPINSINWKIQYNKNNKTYRMLLSICYLVLKGMLQTTDDGDIKITNFIDEQRMCRLYEKFILEFYRKEMPDLNANASKIEWQVDDGYIDLLPEMKTDIMLSKGDSILIIDAKYYSHALQTHFDVSTINSRNIYQIFTYVKNKQEEVKSKKVSGYILYAKTDEELYPSNCYYMSGNKISAGVLDLNNDFSIIKQKLIDIANIELG